MSTSLQAAFVPLATSQAPAPSSSEFRLLIASHPEQARSLRDAGASSTQPVAVSPQKPTCEPQVSLVREGECVTGIHIVCSCGQVIDLRCVYPRENPA